KIVALNKDNGITILLVEQNANYSLSVSSYAYVLETGNIYTEGRSEDLLKNEKIRKAYLGE
ncbi:MAG TPA: ABC transporter ATP-binding protein, partial [Ignavibacteria bacterium]|nr:ABC transporter ATP-binding protein [Ignavibacteria bacterium]